MRLRSALVALALLGSLAAVGTTAATFSKTTSNASNVVTAQRIFSGTRSTSAWVVNDQADGTAADATDAGAISGDARTWNTGSWGTAFSSTRYIETTYSSPLPTGVPISSLSVNFDYRGTAAGDTVCIYFDVRRTSNTTQVLGTHGSSASPLQCTTGTSLQSMSTPLPEITTSADANDLTIRTYMTVSGARPITGEMGTISGTAGNGFGSFTLYETKYIDNASGTPATFPYALAASDGTTVTYSSWATAYNASRFLAFTFPNGIVPSGATVTAATLTHTYRSAGNRKQTCVYYEFWNGGSLITSRGSSAASYSCDDTQNNNNTDTVTLLPDVNTAAELNGLQVKIFGKDNGPSASTHEQLKLSVTYSLD